MYCQSVVNKKGEVYTSQIKVTNITMNVCNRFTEEFTDIFKRCIPFLVDQLSHGEPDGDIVVSVSDVQNFSYLVAGKMSKYSIV